MDMKKIAILGSTGSIGTQTLEVVRENQDIQVMAEGYRNPGDCDCWNDRNSSYD